MYKRQDAAREADDARPVAAQSRLWDDLPPRPQGFWGSADAAPLMRHVEDETREDEGQWQVRRPDADDGTALGSMAGTGAVADAPSVPSSSGSAAAFASGRTAPAGLREAVSPSAFSAASFAEDAEGTGRLSADRQEFFESARQTARMAMPPDHVTTVTGREGSDEIVAERAPAPKTDGPEGLPGAGETACGPGTVVTDESAAGRHELVVGGLTYLGQVAETYLVLRDASGALMLLDQHAAHERVLYERLRKGAFAGTAQCLALPLELALQPVEEERFLEVRDNLERMGFDVSCSGGRLLARGIPPSLSRSEAGEFLREVLAGRKDDIRAMFISLSCKGAIKAGQRLADDEAAALLRQWLHTPEREYCPHGRPSIPVSYTHLTLPTILLV